MGVGFGTCVLMDVCADGCLRMPPPVSMSPHASTCVYVSSRLYMCLEQASQVHVSSPAALSSSVRAYRLSSIHRHLG